jgi:hypothetical protein
MPKDFIENSLFPEKGRVLFRLDFPCMFGKQPFVVKPTGMLIVSPRAWLRPPDKEKAMPKGVIVSEYKIGDRVADLRSHTCNLTKGAQALMQETEAHFNRCDIRAAVKSTSQALSLYPHSLLVLQQAIKIKISAGYLQEGTQLFETWQSLTGGFEHVMEQAVVAIQYMQLADITGPMEILFDLARDAGTRSPVCGTRVGPDCYKVALALNARHEKVAQLNKQLEKRLDQTKLDPRLSFCFANRVSNALRNKCIAV